MIKRLEAVAAADQGAGRPYLLVACVATPRRGVIHSYAQSREIKRTRDGHPYSPNCEVWLPGFVFPFISGLSPTVVYKQALNRVAEFLPFHTLANRQECAEMLVAELAKLDLVNQQTHKLDVEKFQQYISVEQGARKR